MQILTCVFFFLFFGTAMPLYTIRQGGAAEQKVLGIMAEDRTLSTMSYPEWWAALGRQLA